MFFTENAGCRISGNCRIAGYPATTGLPDIRQLPDAGLPDFLPKNEKSGRISNTAGYPAQPYRVGPDLFFLPDAVCFSKKMPDIRQLPDAGYPVTAGRIIRNAGYPAK